MTESEQARGPIRFAPRPGEVRYLPFADMPKLVGETFEGEWFAFDRERFEAFEWATYVSELPFPFGDKLYDDDLIEGSHLLSLMDYLINSIWVVEGENAYGLNYGFDRVRFVSPVHAGQGMRLTGTIAEVRPKGDGFLVRKSCALEVWEGERPGLVAEWWVYWQHLESQNSSERTAS